MNLCRAVGVPASPNELRVLVGNVVQPAVDHSEGQLAPIPGFVVALLVSKGQTRAEAIQSGIDVLLKHGPRAPRHVLAVGEAQAVPAAVLSVHSDRPRGYATVGNRDDWRHLAAPYLGNTAQRPERVLMVDEGAGGSEVRTVCYRPARGCQHGSQSLLRRAAHKLRLLDEVVQQIAKGGFGVHGAQAGQRLVRPHHHVLSPSRAVKPQKTVALGGHVVASEFDRVLAV